MTITVYTFEDADGNEQTWQTQDYDEAKSHAQQYELKLIANEFEWSESEELEDYTPKRNRYRFKVRWSA